ncbi:MAG: phospholipase D family protein [Burkholderiaceae bacterium]|nr:phospholipase D family protein [Burkholderiaceae bacterium]
MNALTRLAALLGLPTLPPRGTREASRSIEDTDGTRLGRATERLERLHPGRSGVLALTEGHDAFATRMLLAEAAECSLDVQYYIWHPDLTGTLLMRALHRAAERGVHVRLLLDDNNTRGMDAGLCALDSHPNVEVRLFNPFVQRDWRWLGYLTDFGRLNRRMHNKSFTADRQVTIVGGRNVGDEYFDAGQEISFVDMDVLAVGAVVPDVCADFERYWTSASAYPIASLLPRPDPDALARTLEREDRICESPAAAPYREALARSDHIERLAAVELALEWTDVKLVSDSPAKVLGKARKREWLARRLGEVLGAPRKELLLVSPYFVPTASGTAALAAQAAGGVAVSVLTNSLAATDVPVVHAGYAKRRRALLRSGLRLFELKPDGIAPRTSRTFFRRLTGSSSASLHAKTFAVDGERIFVGSFNLDPRSAALNTESGFVIESRRLAGQIAAAFEHELAAQSYTLRLDGAGRIEWQDRATPDGPARIHHHEPQTSAGKRALVWLISWLPIEWLL